MDDHLAKSARSPLKDPATGEKAMVLLVDDDASMRDMGMDMLQMLGHSVELARDGREALKMIQEDPDNFNLVISDLRMPEMNGRELAAEIRKNLWPLPFILITGFDYTLDKETFEDLGISEVVAKPFRIETIEMAIRRALASQSCSGRSQPHH